MERKPRLPYIEAPRDRALLSRAAAGCMVLSAVLWGIDTPGTAAMDAAALQSRQAQSDAVSAYPPCAVLPEPGNPSISANQRLDRLYTVPDDSQCATALRGPRGAWEVAQLEPGDKYSFSCRVVREGQPVEWVRLTIRQPNGDMAATGYAPVDSATVAGFDDGPKPVACAMPLAEARRYTD